MIGARDSPFLLFPYLNSLLLQRRAANGNKPAEPSAEKNAEQPHLSAHSALSIAQLGLDSADRPAQFEKVVARSRVRLGFFAS